MVRTLTLTLAILSLPTVLAADGECTPTTYGAGVDLETSVAVADLLAQPADYAGQTVRVEGKVQDVCRMMGCWMELVAADDATGEAIKIKVEDGVIEFPVSTLGHSAVAQGVVDVQELDRDGYIKYQQHLADEQNREFDASSVGEGPFERVQILGTGAEVCAD